MLNNIVDKRTLWKIFFSLNWLIIFGFWFSTSGILFTQGFSYILIALGRIAGLTAAYMILLQFFFMGRTPWLERIFGLDKLSLLHHTNGKWGITFLLFHPLLLVFGYKGTTGISAIQQFLIFFKEYEDVNTAVLGFLLFIIVVGTSLYIVRSKLRYESWYFVHLLAYIAIFSSFGHQFHVGTDIIANKIFYGYWLALYVLVFSNHALFRFIRPVYNFYKHKFYITKIVRENHNAVSIYISGNNLAKFNIHAGQFMIVRFLKKGLWWQGHPFSLSIVPDGRQLRITIKELGDFTKQATKELAVGTKVFIDGPYGVFTELFSVSKKVLCIAGGIGITPVRSLMEQLAKKGRDVVLLYSNKTQKDIIFKGELENVASQYNAKIVHIISEEPGYTGEKGKLDGEKIAKIVPDANQREVFLCGPVPMMNAIIPALKKLGISSKNIHYEKFSLG